MMKIKVKYFQDLNINELHDLLQLRSEVFVVEQECAYQDIDGKDQKALHVMGYKDEVLLAYTRIFEPGYYFNEAGIGRVVVTKKERNQGLGYIIMKASIKAIKEHYNTSKIKLSAQTYLKQYYNNLGFKEVGKEYFEDGILHIEMLKE